MLSPRYAVLGASILVFSPMVSLAVDYTAEVKPLLSRKCYACHGSLKQEANLRLDTAKSAHQGGDSGPALVAGNPVKSLLIERVSSEDADLRMPPEGEPLTKPQVALITEWIKQGAAAPENESPQPSTDSHWSLQPLAVTSPQIPSVESLQPIDRFIYRRLSDADLEFSPPADPVSLVRRLHFTLHGLPPSPETARIWVDRLANATSTADHSRVISQLVDQLLASPRYGERWAQHWLDVVRYADTHGFEVNTPRPNAWPYRDYVIRAFNEDRPFDQFVREQLAGDALGEDAATGFLVAAAVLLPGQIGKDEASKRLARQDALDEIVVGTSATFLGLTVGCARCHDHKFDPISQKDYYAMQAFFAGVDYGDRDILEGNGLRLQQAKRLKPELSQLKAELRQFQLKAFIGDTIVIDDEDEDRVTHLATKNGHGTNPAGTQRGYRDDPGGVNREPNLSRTRYTWWTNHEGQDVFTWDLKASGRHRLWISWGVHGSGVHTRDARYVLDQDGDLTTQDDQQEIAQADQYYFVGQTSGETEHKPLWSGLKYTGVHDLQPTARLILRGGKTGAGITADVIVLQSVVESKDAGAESGNLPQQPPALHPPALRAPVNALRNIETWSPIDAKFVRFTSLETIDDNRHEPCIDELEIFAADSAENIALASRGVKAMSSGNYSNSGKHQLKHINDGNYGNSKSWISSEYGRGWVQLELPAPARVVSIAWGRDQEGKFKDRLPVRYRVETSLDGKHWTLVARSDDRVAMGVPYDRIALLTRRQHLLGAAKNAAVKDIARLASRVARLEREYQQLTAPLKVYGGIFRTPDATRLLQRGDPEQPLDELRPHTPVSIATAQLKPPELDTSTPDQQRRLALANWVTDPANPLTPRVIVNRIWQQHFGAGLVETPSDFGFNGVPPSHPELLDYLAADFLDHDCSLKHLHRAILTSRTFQQSSRIRSDSQQKDGDVRWLWRYPSRRIEAESIRDSILSVSGQLNLTMGGPGFDFFKSRGGLNGFPPLEQFTGNQLRRMIYAHKVRMEPVPVFGAFDCPDAGQAMPKRSMSTTAIQALNLLNSRFVSDYAIRFAQRIENQTAEATGPDKPETGAQVGAQVGAVFMTAFSRPPTSVEREAAIEAANKHGLAVVCRALLNTNEFLFIP